MSGRLAVLVELELHSPFSLFVPLTSKASETYPLPPPTTLAGALAYPYFRSRGSLAELEDGVPPVVRLLEDGKLLYAAAAPVGGYVISRAVERIYQHIYLRGEYWRDPERAYSIAPRSLSWINGLVALYIVADPELAKCAHGIVRLGRKETLVSVGRVVVKDVREVRGDSSACFTRFYFPLGIADDYDRSGSLIVSMPALRRENFEKRGEPVLEEFVVPRPPALEPLPVVVNAEGAILSIEGVEVPVPRRALQGGPG